jgi:thioredoxin reductase
MCTTPLWGFSMDTLPTEVDAVVIGGGPAGLSAASWLGRHRRRTLVVDAGQPRNRYADAVHGVLGHEGADPGQLLERGRRELEGYAHVELYRGTVTDIAATDTGFDVQIDSAGRVTAARLVVATGTRDEYPDVKGFHEHYGTTVFHCPSCDGYEARGDAVAVLGWGEHVPAFAVELLDWAESVCVVTDVEDPDITPEQRRRLADRGIEVVDGEASALLGEPGHLTGVRLADGTEVEATMAFFSIAHHPVVELAVRLGCGLTAEGCLEVDAQYLTTVEGVYAAGDLTPGAQLVSVAAAEGVLAGVACATSLRGQTTSDGAPSPAPDVRPLTPQHVPDA